MEGSLNISNNENVSYFANSAIGIVGGYSAYRYLPKYMKEPYAKYYLEKCHNISPLEHNQYRNAAIQSFTDSKYFNPRLQIVDVNRANWKIIANDINQRYNYARNNRNSNPVAKFLTKIFSKKDGFIANKVMIIAQGKNASYIPLTSQILLNKDKMGITTFHELGHFINGSSKGIRRMLARSRVLSIVSVPAILGIGLLTPKREEGDEYTNPLAKTAAFIKKHCGVLAGISMLPVIIEEGVASINGAQLAKKVLNKNMYKKLNKFNFMAFSSYIIGASILGICTALAVYIKDKVSGAKPVKVKD